MSQIKNFGLSGIGSNVQYGKNGGQVVWDTNSSVFKVTENDGTTLSQLRVAQNPVSTNDAASKNYVDTTAQGLAIKDSVRAATTSSDMSQLTYNATGNNNKGEFTFTSPLVFDGITIADNDRVLVKNHEENNTAPFDNGRGNGLYKADVTNGVLTRTQDSDGTPSNELRGGVFAFVVEGSTQQSTGWAISSPTGNVDVGTDEITFSQFSGAGTLLDGDGLNRDGNVLNLDFSDLSENTIVGTDTIGFYDTSSGANAKTTVNNFVSDLNLLTNPNGNNPLSVNTGNGLELNANGSSVELDLNINGVTNTASDVADEMVFHDVSNSGTNIKRTISEFITDHDILTGSGGGALTGSNGITINNNDVQLALNSLVTTTATQTSDIMVFDDATTAGTSIARTIQGFIDDHGLVQDSDFSSNGIAVRTSGGSYANRTIEASSVAGEEGLKLTNGDGVAANPTVGLDISSLTLASSTSETDQVIINDGTNNVRANLSDVVAGSTVSWTSISDGTNTANADVSSDVLTFNGNNGVSVVVSDDPETVTVGLNVDSLPKTNVVEGADLFAFYDNSSPGNHIARSASDVLSDLNVVNNIGSNGFAVRTSEDAYTSRSIVASTSTGTEGISITNGDGVADNPTVGVDINSRTALGATPDTSDEFLVFDSSVGSNKKVTMGNIASAVAEQVSDDSINDADGDTSVQVDNTDSDEVRIFSGKAGNGSQRIATFETQTSTNNDEQFQFRNGEGEVQFIAGDTGGFGSNSTNDVDIRLVPGSNGNVFVGDTGAGSIQSDPDNSLVLKGGSANTTNAGNLVLEGGSGSGTNNSGDVILRGGTGGSSEGSVVIQDSNSNDVMTFSGVSSAINNFVATNSASGNNPELEVSGDDTNITMKLSPKGSGTLQVPTGYEANVSSNEDLVNKAWVDNAISSGAVSGSVSSIQTSVDFTTASTQAIGTIPANASIIRVSLIVDAVSDTTTEVDVGDATNGVASYMEDALNDPENLGTYVTDVSLVNVGGSSVTANATVTNAGTSGSGRVLIEYRNA